MNLLAEMTVRLENGVPVARLDGEIDLSNANAIGAELFSAVSNAVVGLIVDLTGLTYLDSAGVKLLYELNTRLQHRRQQLRIVLPEKAGLRRVLTLAQIDSVVAIDETVDEGLEQIRGQS